EEAAILHRLNDEAPHRRNALLQHRALLQLARAAKPFVQLIPDAGIGPVLDFFIVTALQIEPRQCRPAHRVKRESAIGVGVDQFMIGRRRFRQDTEPAKRIFAFENPKDALGETRPANSMETIAAGNEIAIDLLWTTLMCETNLRPRGLDVVNGD